MSQLPIHNTYNTAISALHDDVLLMVFEAGTRDELVPKCTFAILVSHFSR